MSCCTWRRQGNLCFVRNDLRRNAKNQRPGSAYKPCSGDGGIDRFRLSRVTVMELEFSALLDPIAKRPNPLSQVPLIGPGVRHAYGISSGFAIMGPSGNDTESFRQRYGAAAFDEFMSSAVLNMERSILNGPVDDDEENALRVAGWQPERATSVTEKRAEQESEFKKILDVDPKLRRGHLRDLVSTRELLIEFQNICPRALEERGLVLKDLMWDQESARRVVQSMPSTVISVELKTAWHRNGQRNLAINDIYDIDALALATSYCDIVVTEKACHDILKVAGLPEQMNTPLLHRLSDLPSVLSDRTSKRQSLPGPTADAFPG